MRSLPPGYSQFRWVTGVSSFMVITIGCLVLVGWALDITVLKSIFPHLVTMKANTAIAFVIAGTSLALVPVASCRPVRRIAQCCALMTTGIGALTLAQYLWGVDLGIDQLLVTENAQTVGTSSPGRMAPNTALNFGLVGLALLLLHQNAIHHHRSVQLLTLGVGLLSLLSLIGYIYDVKELYGIASFTQMAILTALTFLMLCVGMLFVYPQRGLVKLLTAPTLVGFLGQRLLLAAIAIPLSLGGIILIGQQLGWYSPRFGVAILVVLSIALLTLLIWWSLVSLEHLEAERQGTALALRDREASLQVKDRIEQELRRSESIFRNYFELPLIGIAITSPEKGWMEVNHKLCEILGYSRDQLLAMTWAELTYPDDLETELLCFDRAIAGETEGYSLDKRFIRQDGQVIFASISARCVRRLDGSIDYLVALVQDISERKQSEIERQRAQEALQRQEADLRELLGNTPDVIIRCDRHFRYLYVNPTVERLTGMPATAFLGKTIREVGASAELSTLWEETLNRVFEQRQEQVIEFQAPSVEGLRYYQSRIVPELDEDGIPQQALVVSRDITDLKQAQMQWLQEQVARAQAEAANRMKDEFLAVLSHELRTPLNAILGWARLLQTRRFDSETTKRALETIERNAELQTQLVNDLLDISCIMQGGLHLNLCPIDLIPALEAAIATIRPAADTKQLTLQFSIRNPDLGGNGEFLSSPRTVNPETIISPQPSVFRLAADPKRLQQIFWNLLTNAVKFTPIQGRVDVTLSLSTAAPDVIEPLPQVQKAVELEETHLPTRYAQITIRDTGKGIRPDFLPYVFDYFRQADSSITRSHGGLGLGLAIVHHLVQMHGGRILAESPGEGLGATFTVYLPLLK